MRLGVRVVVLLLAVFVDVPVSAVFVDLRRFVRRIIRFFVRRRRRRVVLRRFRQILRQVLRFGRRRFFGNVRNFILRRLGFGKFLRRGFFVRFRLFFCPIFRLFVGFLRICRNGFGFFCRFNLFGRGFVQRIAVGVKQIVRRKIVFGRCFGFGGIFRRVFLLPRFRFVCHAVRIAGFAFLGVGVRVVILLLAVLVRVPVSAVFIDLRLGIRVVVLLFPVFVNVPVSAVFVDLRLGVRVVILLFAVFVRVPVSVAVSALFVAGVVCGVALVPLGFMRVVNAVGGDGDGGGFGVVVSVAPRVLLLRFRRRRGGRVAVFLLQLGFVFAQIHFGRKSGSVFLFLFLFARFFFLKQRFPLDFLRFVDGGLVGRLSQFVRVTVVLFVHFDDGFGFFLLFAQNFGGGFLLRTHRFFRLFQQGRLRFLLVFRQNVRQSRILLLLLLVQHDNGFGQRILLCLRQRVGDGFRLLGQSLCRHARLHFLLFLLATENFRHGFA